MKARYLPEADEELHAEADYLEDESPGTGMDFVRCVREKLRRIRSQPSLYSPVEPPVRGREVREAILNPFNLRVVYEVRAAEILVVAIAHNRRRPRYWRSRLRNA